MESKVTEILRLEQLRVWWQYGPWWWHRLGEQLLDAGSAGAESGESRVLPGRVMWSDGEQYWGVSVIRKLGVKESPFSGRENLGGETNITASVGSEDVAGRDTSKEEALSMRLTLAKDICREAEAKQRWRR